MAFFDAFGDSYGDVVQDSISFSGLEHDFFTRAKIAMLGRLFADHFGPERPRLLDVGCGTGTLHGGLAGLCGALSGCDPSSASLAAAERAHPGVAYRPNPGAELPWEAAAFDASLAVCVFHHVVPADRPALLAEMRRVTRPGGLVIVIEHNPWNPLTRLAVARCALDVDAELLGARTARSLLREAGLDAVARRHFLLFPTEAALALRIEHALAAMPLGAQYLAYGTA